MEMSECARKTVFDESGIKELSDRIAAIVAQYADEHVKEECATFDNDDGGVIRENEELKVRIEEINESYAALKSAYDELKDKYPDIDFETVIKGYEMDALVEYLALTVRKLTNEV